LRALDRGGYLNRDGCEAFEALTDSGETVERLLADVRASAAKIAQFESGGMEASGRGSDSDVQSSSAEPPSPQADPDTPGRIACDNCGKPLPAFARFCGHCGHRLQP
jgi:hypothetical protein